MRQEQADLRQPAGAATVLDVSAGEFFTPVVDGSGCPIHAALYGELLDTARVMPLADLQMTVGLVGVVARRMSGDPGNHKAGPSSF